MELDSSSLYNVLAKSEKSYPQRITFLKIPGISFKKPSPGEAGARRIRGKTRNDQTGGMFWLKSEPFLTKIQIVNFDCSRLRRDGRNKNFSARAGREEKGVWGKGIFAPPSLFRRRNFSCQRSWRTAQIILLFSLLNLG